MGNESQSVWIPIGPASQTNANFPLRPTAATDFFSAPRPPPPPPPRSHVRTAFTELRQSSLSRRPLAPPISENQQMSTSDRAQSPMSHMGIDLPSRPRHDSSAPSHAPFQRRGVSARKRGRLSSDEEDDLYSMPPPPPPARADVRRSAVGSLLDPHIPSANRKASILSRTPVSGQPQLSASASMPSQVTGARRAASPRGSSSSAPLAVASRRKSANTGTQLRATPRRLQTDAKRPWRQSSLSSGMSSSRISQSPMSSWDAFEQSLDSQAQSITSTPRSRQNITPSPASIFSRDVSVDFSSGHPVVSRSQSSVAPVDFASGEPVVSHGPTTATRPAQHTSRRTQAHMIPCSLPHGMREEQEEEEVKPLRHQRMEEESRTPTPASLRLTRKTPTPVSTHSGLRTGAHDARRLAASRQAEEEEEGSDVPIDVPMRRLEDEESSPPEHCESDEEVEKPESAAESGRRLQALAGSAVRSAPRASGSKLEAVIAPPVAAAPRSRGLLQVAGRRLASRRRGRAVHDDVIVISDSD
jgi:hypothetical protein